MSVNIRDSAAHASSLWAGMVFPNREEAILEAWGQGCLELHYAMADIAISDAELRDTLYDSLSNGFPGVYMYEVTEELGAFVGRHICAHGDLPPAALLQAEQRRLCLELFTYGAPEDRARVVELLQQHLPLTALTGERA